MSKTGKTWLIIAGAIVVFFSGIFVIMMAFENWDFSKFSTDRYQTKSIEVNADFSKLYIDVNTADIVFKKSQNGKCVVECVELSNMHHDVVAEDGTLNITCIDNRKWYNYIGINIIQPKITVYLPKTQYDSVTVGSTTGNVDIPTDFSFENVDIKLTTGSVKLYGNVNKNLYVETTTGSVLFAGNQAGNVDIGVTTGDVKIVNTSCENIISEGSTGDVALKDVKASGKITINRSTGDIRIQDSDGGEVYLSATTGDITASFLTSKTYNARATTGRVNVPNSTADGGVCEIKTTTGDIWVR